MATDEERFPKINKQPKPNVITNGQFIAEGNSVHPSAQNVIVTGSRNVVGEGCKDIGIFNSSGCVVIAGVHGATLINTSGVIIGDHDQTYLNGSLMPNTSKKIYKALATQDGSTSPPTIKIIENTLGNVVWTRDGAGEYRGTLTGQFTLDKTWCVTGNTQEDICIISLRRSNVDSVVLISINTLGAMNDYGFADLPILIEVNT